MQGKHAPGMKHLGFHSIFVRFQFPHEKKKKRFCFPENKLGITIDEQHGRWLRS